MMHQGGRRSTTVAYVHLPLLVRSAWVPEQGIILIDAALDPAGRAQALAEIVAARAAHDAREREAS